MTITERLEEIENNVRQQSLLKEDGLEHQVIVKLSDYVYLHEQAESVQELEKQIERHKSEKYTAFKKNSRYREALENILTEGEYEDINQQLERIMEIASRELQGESHE